MNKLRGISEDLLSGGYDVRISTSGSSMFPCIRTGDRITISPDRTPKIGDVVVFKRHDEMVCHRLAKVFEKNDIRYYQTRGDSHFGLDEPITAGQILGKVIRIERENVSLLRRTLLIIYPILRFRQINAHVASALRRVRDVFIAGRKG